MPENKDLVDTDSIPASWRSIIAEIPIDYRASAVRFATSIVANVDARTGLTPGSVAHDIAVESTGLASLQYAAYIPFHVIPNKHLEVAAATLGESGPEALLKRIRNSVGTGRTVLVIGDGVPLVGLEDELTRMHSERPIERYVAGPGPDVEAALRTYAGGLSIPRHFVSSADISAGATWTSSPGPALDRLIDALFEIGRLDTVIVFSPTRLPSTLFVLDKARQLGLTILMAGQSTRPSHGTGGT